ncbi:hypothetical protein [Mucilaginibacter sp. PPCGB 2223]|uniref:hypothetical protein n=1 Tax=Mucilaginibacter sp. PPCGB 2223 TaxID=1886027 RepID=UPI001112495E|nr:hypothetical protein [Mucilaginibacter sp. PPCGB 2223]
MKQQEIVKKIGVILKELQDQYQFIEETKEPVNDLELELFVANGHFLTDHIEILRKINEQTLKTQSVKQTVKKTSTITEKFFEPVIQPVRVAPEKKEPTPEYADFEPAEEAVATQTQEPEPELPPALPVDEPEAPVAEEHETPVHEEPVIRHELVLDEDIVYTDENEDAEESREEYNYTGDEVIDDDTAFRKVEEHFSVPEITPTETEQVADFPQPEMPSYAVPEPVSQSPDDFNKPPLTLNQILSAQRSGTTRISEQLPPIKDLRSAINLNDKMLYVKDLFHGYSLSYSEAIEILNRMSGFEEADKFLRTNYAVKNSWDEKQATVEKFYALLRRRFS